MMSRLLYYMFVVVSFAAVVVIVLYSMVRSEQTASLTMTEKWIVLVDDQNSPMPRTVETDSFPRHGPPVPRTVETDSFPRHGPPVVSQAGLSPQATESSTITRAPVEDSINHLSNKTRVLLFWSKLYGTDPWIRRTHTVECYESEFKCVYTSEKRFFEDSDAVVFHSRAVGLLNSVRQASKQKRPRRQRWVLFADGESPANTADMSFLNGLINWTASYMRGADILQGLAAAPGVYKWGGFDPNRNYLENKTAMAAILISHCLSERMNWVKKLQQYISVDVYGRCGTMNCGNEKNCFATLRKYKFYLSFENSYCMDYITEKFYFNSLKNGVVPVVIAWVNTSDTPPLTVPPGSLINALDFPSVQDLANYMVEVGSSPALYNKYFRWRSSYNVILDTFGRVFCEVCKKVHLDTESVKSHPDIGSWFSRGRCCKPYPVPH